MLSALHPQRVDNLSHSLDTRGKATRRSECAERGEAEAELGLELTLSVCGAGTSDHEPPARFQPAWLWSAGPAPCLGPSRGIFFPHHP